MSAQNILIEDSQSLKQASEDAESLAFDYLRSFPAINARHSGATLFEHLKGVYDKLVAWQCEQPIAFAGLFHSVYGTTSFRRQTLPLSARPKIAEIIGSEAEELAFEFCSLDTRQFTTQLRAKVRRDGAKGREILSPKEDALLHVFTANWLEQFPRMRARQKSRNVSFFKEMRPLLCASAVSEIDQIFDRPAQPISICDGPLTSDESGAAQRFMMLDDFVPSLLQLKLSALMEMNIWRYGWKAADTQSQHFFWHSHFAGDNDDGGEVDCENELHDRPLVAPVLELWQLIQQSIGAGHVPVRVYANGHTFGDDGHVHTDATTPGHYTSLYYAHPQWDHNWGGETLFFNSDRDTILHSSFPKPGRLVHFSGTIPHTARSPARDCPALRSVIVIKSFKAPDQTHANP